MVIMFYLSFFFNFSGSLIEYAVILFCKQKDSKYGIPSQSVYSNNESAAAAIAEAIVKAFNFVLGSDPEFGS